MKEVATAALDGSWVGRRMSNREVGDAVAALFGSSARRDVRWRRESAMAVRNGIWA